MKKTISTYMLLLGGIFISFMVLACDELNIKDLLEYIKENKNISLQLSLSKVEITEVSDDSNVQIKWEAPKKAEEVVITATPVSGGKPIGKPIKVVIPKSVYQKSGQSYILKGLQQKIKYEIKIIAKAEGKVSPEKKETVVIQEDITPPKDRLKNAQVISCISERRSSFRQKIG